MTSDFPKRQHYIPQVLLKHFTQAASDLTARRPRLDAAVRAAATPAATRSPRTRTLTRHHGNVEGGRVVPQPTAQASAHSITNLASHSSPICLRSRRQLHESRPSTPQPTLKLPLEAPRLAAASQRNPREPCQSKTAEPTAPKPPGTRPMQGQRLMTDNRRRPSPIAAVASLTASGAHHGGRAPDRGLGAPRSSCWRRFGPGTGSLLR